MRFFPSAEGDVTASLLVNSNKLLLALFQLIRGPSSLHATLLNLMVELEDLALSRADKMKLTSSNIQSMQHLAIWKNTVSAQEWRARAKSVFINTAQLLCRQHGTGSRLQALFSKNSMRTNYCCVEANRRLTLKIKNFWLFQTRGDWPWKQVTIGGSKASPDLCSSVSLGNNGGEDDFGSYRYYRKPPIGLWIKRCCCKFQCLQRESYFNNSDKLPRAFGNENGHCALSRLF